MSEADEAEREAADERPKFVFPTRRSAEEQPDEAEEPLAILCSVPVKDAVGFCDRLEAEGIPCGARESATNSAASGEGLTRGAIFADVYVRAEDLEIAQEILARPPEEPDEEETPGEREARLVANWVCPRCERPGLELLPLSRGMWHLRMGCFGMLALPVLMGWLSWLLPRWKGTSEFPNWAWMIWLVVGLWLAWACVLPERGRVCKGCEWRTGAR
jgi:hypothetical protein